MVAEGELIIEARVRTRSLATWVGTRSLPSKDRLKSGILAIMWRLPKSIALTIVKAPVLDPGKVFIHVIHNGSTLLNRKSYVKSVVINVGLGLTALRDRRQVVDVNTEGDGPRNAPLWYSSLNGKFI